MSCTACLAPPRAAAAPPPAPTTPHAGFAAATVTPERLTLAFYTLEGGEAAAFETTIERRVEPPS